MKREEAEKIWRQKFEAFGLNECFEFLYRDWSAHKGRKCGMRCRKCGAKFETWAFAEFIRGRQAHILCLNCGVSSDGNDVWERSPQCDSAMEYYVQGHTVKETAERFNVTKAQINNSVKRRGLTNGRDWKESGAASNAKRSEEAAILFIQKVANGEVSIPKGSNRHKCRAIKYGCEYDSKITLKKLIKRDGLQCAICGGVCDWNDHSWSEYSGPTYPSIDHIIPMAKGGGHTWDNVQVAHMICNSRKGDKVEAIS